MLAERSVLPPKAQVPAAIVLGVLFILLLVWQFGGDGGQANVAVATSGDRPVKIDRTTELNDLRLLIDDLRRLQTAVAVTASAAPAFRGDPFFDAISVAASGEVGRSGRTGDGNGPGVGGEISGGEGVSAGFDRAEKLNGLKLMAISTTVESSIALINGRLVRVGEKIAGFLVEEISESEVVLSDTIGTERIGLPEVIGL